MGTPWYTGVYPDRGIDGTKACVQLFEAVLSCCRKHIISYISYDLLCVHGRPGISTGSNN
eukprot:SAG31_NODE_24345_length_483_cov_2.872396_2_plen_59_part_01